MELVPYRDEHFDRYQAFARRSWGDDAYQATRNYIDWLYRENPSPQKRDDDFLLAVTPEQQIVGCIHKMRLPWRVGSKSIEIPALHNLIVDEAHRDGTGFMLIMRAQGDHEHILIPGVAQPLSEVYVKLKYQGVNANWYRTLLRPVAGAFRLARNRLKMPSKSALYFDQATVAATRLPAGVTAITSPSPELLSRVAATLEKRTAAAQAAPRWDASWLRWRFFHPRGPRHCLVHRESDFLILSLGPRHGMNAARIVEGCADNVTMTELVASARRVLQSHGAHVLLTFSADAALNESLAAAGFVPQREHIDTYFYHKRRREQFATYQFHGSAGDFGFEAITG